MVIWDPNGPIINWELGCFDEVGQSNILIPSTIPFIRKCVFLNLIFSQNVVGGGGGGAVPLPASPPALALPAVKACFTLYATLYDLNL